MILFKYIVTKSLNNTQNVKINLKNLKEKVEQVEKEKQHDNVGTEIVILVPVCLDP